MFDRLPGCSTPLVAAVAALKVCALVKYGVLVERQTVELQVSRASYIFDVFCSCGLWHVSCSTASAEAIWLCMRRKRHSTFGAFARDCIVEISALIDLDSGTV